MAQRGHRFDARGAEGGTVHATIATAPITTAAPANVTASNGSTLKSILSRRRVRPTAPPRPVNDGSTAKLADHD
jgi:hypothetical protein